MARADIIISSTVSGSVAFGAGTCYIVPATNGARYIVFIDRGLDVCFVKSTDGGFTWSNPTVVFAGTTTAVANWYGRWSGLSNDLIYCWYIDNGTGDILYRTIDTASSDALGTQTTVFNGTSTANGGALTGWADRNGDLRVVGAIDNGVEDGAWSSTDAGATWADTIADPTEGATQDQYFGLPGWAAATANGMIIFVDASANGLSVKRYDDVGDAWTEAAIIADGSFVDTAATGSFPHVAVAVDIANSRNIVAAWSAVDAANQDLRLFFITNTTITESAANVVLNATDDMGLVALGIATDTNTIYVFYGGKSDGSETFPTAITINYKTTTDDGATWSAETALSLSARSSVWLSTMPRFTGNFGAVFCNDTIDDNAIYSALLPSGGVATPMFSGSIVR